MFQSFAAPTSRKSDLADRLSALRKQMQNRKLDWFLVPHADEHQNEYLPERAERLAWLTGFTGSAGFALIGLEVAYLFVDGRYTVQSRKQTDTDIFEICDLVSSPPSVFASEKINKGEIIAYDPWLMTIAQKKAWQKTADKCSAELVAVENPIDEIWQDQPAPPSGKAWLHPEKYAGKSASEKLNELQSIVAKENAVACLLTDPASIAWAFNIRGNDLVHNPLALSYAIIHADTKAKAQLFIEPAKFSETDRQKISATVSLLPPDQLKAELQGFRDGEKILCDPNLVSTALAEILSDAGAQILEKRDPVVILRAVKNETELSGAREAHLRDGVAMTKFLHWLHVQPAGSLTEIDAAKALETFRHDTAKAMGSRLEEISFDTISGAGANGAIVHYRVNEESNAAIEADTLYLVDSGGQYLDGTTDITRTVAIGTPPPNAIMDNTLVLKGHIAIATARFPKGTRGVDIDALARIALWKFGKDFAHGTGHGIGSFLNVHEGPQSISKRGMEAFKPGMIVSNEPGFYREGHYGIRIENLLIVNGASPVKGGDQEMLGFETITLCPIDLNLIDPALLTPEEKDWLNAYHERVCEALKPHLDNDEANWLKAVTRPV